MTQARQSQYAAQTDFINVSAGLDTLMNYYCAGRGTWNSQSDAVITTGCSGTATVCTKGTGTGSGTKWQYPHLWASLELVARKSALGATRITTLRQRLQCGAQDANTGFAGFAMMMLGYLGDDAAGNTFLVGQAGGTGDLATIAKAALLIATSNKTTYEAAVKAGLTSGTVFVKAACAAAIGIVDLDDATVTSTLVPLTKWTEPDSSDNGQSIYAAYLLSLVAWDRRCWAANAGDVGAVSFYEGGTAARCTGAGGSTGGSTGSTGGSTGSTGGNIGTGGKTGTGGSTGSGGSTVAGGNTATGGKTGTANGGTTGTPPIGGTAATGGKTGTAAGGTTGTPTGGTTGTPVGGTTGTPVGGNTGTPVAGNTETGGNTALATGGGIAENTGGAAGGVPVETGGGTGAGLGGQTGNGGAPGSGSASQNGSAGGCGYVPSGRATIPLGFVLAGVGLAFAVRRRRRR
jgi:MYXO-CTERM domain-containing protein